MKKIFFYISIFFLFYVCSTHYTFAAEWGGVAKTGIYLVAIATVFTYFIGIFLDPSWINGSMFGLNEYFRSIWILVSNVVYLIFAFLLIWIAFMNIIGKGEDKYQLKQALPKFIVGVLIVPFSWFIVQFVLSISAILTVSALTLPSDTFSSYKEQIDFPVPKDCTINLKDFFNSNNKGSGETVTNFDCKGYFEKKDDNNSIELSTLMDKGGMSDSVGGLIASYSFGILGIDKILKLKNDFSTSGDVLAQLLLDLLFVVIYSILIIALVLVLIVRGLYLWVFTMLSPILGLMYFFGKNEGGEGFISNFNFKEFIALAFVPVYVMLSLSFGMLFLSVIAHSDMKNGNISGMGNDVFKLESTGPDSDKLIIGKVNGQDNYKDNIVIEVKGIGFTKGADLLGSGLTTSLGFIGKLLLNIFGVVIFWVAIMSAIRSSSITKAVVEPLQSFGGQVGSIISKSPQYLPIFGGHSMKSSEALGSSVQSHIARKVAEPGNLLADQLFDLDEFIKKINDIKTMSNTSLNGKRKIMDELLQLSGEARNQADINIIKEVAKDKMGVELLLDFNSTKREMAKQWQTYIKNEKVTFEGKSNTKRYTNAISIEKIMTNGPSAIPPNDDLQSISRTINVQNNDKMNININGSEYIGTRDKKSGELTKMDNDTGYKNLAKYIVTNNLTESDFLREIIEKLEVATDSKETFKEEISKYINDDGVYIHEGGDVKIENLTNLFKNNSGD